MKLADELVQHFIGDVEVSIFLVQPTVQDLLIGLVGDGVGMHDVRSPGVECLEHVSGDSANRFHRRQRFTCFLNAFAEPAQDIAACFRLKLRTIYARIHMVGDFGHETAQRSKAIKRDAYVILPGMVMRGFPNVKVDDPLFSLIMPQGDTFPSSEERRLFYVALTRATRSVAMFTVAGRRSAFLQELIDEGVVAPWP